jgi:hypothetical protein
LKGDQTPYPRDPMGDNEVCAAGMYRLQGFVMPRAGGCGSGMIRQRAQGGRAGV